MSTIRVNIVYLLAILFSSLFVMGTAKGKCPLNADRWLCRWEARLAAAASAPRQQDSVERLDPSLYQGDIMLTRKQRAELKRSQLDGGHRERRATIGRFGNRQGRLWRGGVVYYAFTPWSLRFGEPQLRVVKRAMKFLQDNSCVRFVEMGFERRYQVGLVLISHVPGSGCSSGVGYSYGIRMNLGSRCMSLTDNSVVHEIMHALGFWHEQSRMDRDEFITYRQENVLPGFEFNFNKETGADNLDTEYDVNSIMHYDGYEFKRPGAPPVLVAKKRGVTLGQRFAPSLMDMFQINRLYQCNAKLNWGRGLECSGCMSTVSVVAKTSSNSNTITRPIQIEFIVKRGQRYVHRLLILSTRLGSVRTYFRGQTDRWEFPVANCITPSDIEMVALRGSSGNRWRIDTLRLYGHTPQGSFLLGHLNDISVRLGTEQDSQRILEKVNRPSCQDCENRCVKSVSVSLKHERVRDTPRSVNYWLILSWNRDGLKNVSKLTMPTMPVRFYSNFQTQIAMFPLNTSYPCLTAASLDFSYFLPFDTAGKPIYKGRSTVLANATIVAHLEGGSQYVMAELVKPFDNDSVAANIRVLDRRSCTACLNCENSES